MKAIIEKLSNNLILKFSSTNGQDFWAEVSCEDNKKLIPLLLTKEEAEKSIQIIRKIDVSDFSLDYVNMIVAGCLKIVIRGLHL